MSVSFRAVLSLWKPMGFMISLRSVRMLYAIAPESNGSRWNIRCGAALFDQLDKAEILAYRKDDYQWNVLVADKEKARRKYKNAVVDDATIDDILLLYVKGEQAK